MHSEHSTRAVYVYGIISILWICVRAYTSTQLLLCELYYCYKCVPRCRFSVAVGQFYARTTKAQLRPPSFASGWMAHSSFFVFGSCHLWFYLAIFIPQPCARVNSEAAPMNRVCWIRSAYMNGAPVVEFYFLESHEETGKNEIWIVIVLSHCL